MTQVLGAAMLCELEASNFIGEAGPYDLADLLPFSVNLLPSS